MVEKCEKIDGKIENSANSLLKGKQGELEVVPSTGETETGNGSDTSATDDNEKYTPPQSRRKRQTRVKKESKSSHKSHHKSKRKSTRKSGHKSHKKSGKKSSRDGSQ